VPPSLPAEVRERIERLEIPFNRFGFDPYGISKKEVSLYLTVLGGAYRHYFHVTHGGLSHVPVRGRCMLVGNHSGGIAVDASMVTATLFFEMEPPRLAHGMAEKFIARVPFASTLLSRAGQFPGLPEHAVRLLEDERCLLVFPEGAKGTAKLFHERYSLVDFGSGFARLAAKTKTPIIPFAFFGAGEALPTVFNETRIAKLLGVPYFPITPYLLPLPLPARMHVEFGAPIDVTGADDDESAVPHVERVRNAIADLLEAGRGAHGTLPLLGGRDGG
jgi:1-acyl-sn-glycerol-3-phosphate acyltransferase